MQPCIIWLSNFDQAIDLEIDSIRQSTGFEIIASHNFSEIRFQVNHRIPDVIFLDFPSPQLYDFVHQLRADVEIIKDTVPIICVVHKDHGEEGLRCLKAGATDYLCKPYEKWEILARIQINLRLKTYQDQLTRKNKELESYSDMLLKLNSKLESMARLDELTQIWNRRAFNEQIDSIHNHSVRYHHMYCILMADLDYFKQFNDHYGHQMGDVILKQVAKSISRACRSTDFVARFGGEEFVIILPETDAKAGNLLANRVITAIQDLRIEHRYNHYSNIVTISIGLANFNPARKQVESWKQVLARADAALYAAKDAGRNQVCQH